MQRVILSTSVLNFCFTQIWFFQAHLYSHINFMSVEARFSGELLQPSSFCGPCCAGRCHRAPHKTPTTRPASSLCSCKLACLRFCALRMPQRGHMLMRACPSCVLSPTRRYIAAFIVIIWMCSKEECQIHDPGERPPDA